MDYVPSGRVTTKDPEWRRARTKLGIRGSAITTKDVTALFGINSITAVRWAQAGKLGAYKASGSPGSPWRFSIDKIREELGMDPLPEGFGPEEPNKPTKKGPCRGRTK